LVSQQDIESAGGGDGLDPVCGTARRLKQSAGEAVVRAIHLKGLTAPELVRAGMKSLRSSDISLLKGGSFHKFGLNRILRLCEFVGCTVRIEIDLPFSPVRGIATANADRALLALCRAGEAARTAEGRIPPRKHPGAHAAAGTIATVCSRIVGTLRAAGRAAERDADRMAAALAPLASILAAYAGSLPTDGNAAVNRTIAEVHAAVDALESLSFQTTEMTP